MFLVSSAYKHLPLARWDQQLTKWDFSSSQPQISFIYLFCKYKIRADTQHVWVPFRQFVQSGPGDGPWSVVYVYGGAITSRSDICCQLSVMGFPYRLHILTWGFLVQTTACTPCVHVLNAKILLEVLVVKRSKMWTPLAQIITA